MGIFSSKYKTTVGTSVTRAVDDNQVPDAIKSGMVKSLTDTGDQLIENIMDEMTGSIAYRAERMYRYGKNNYLYGLPEGTGFTAKAPEEIVKTVIEAEIGQPITIDYCHFGPINLLHAAWMKLQDEYVYDPVLNRFAYMGYWSYLSDMIAYVKEATADEISNGSLDHWGIPPKGLATPQRPATGNAAGFSEWRTDENAATDYVRVFYYYVNQFNTPLDDFMEIPIAGFSDTSEYFHVRYLVNGQPRYWLYEHNTGVHASLDKLYEPDEPVNGSYFPWVYFRYNKQSVNNNKETIQYIQSKKMCDYIGMDYETVAEAINENPDIADVENAFLMMAVPAVSTNKIEARYLFDYFSNIYDSSPDVQEAYRGEDFINKAMARVITERNHTILIQDKKFKMSLTFSSMQKKRKAGSIGPKGTYLAEYGKVQHYDQQGNLITDVDKNVHIYRYQSSWSSYVEVIVYGLESRYYVFGDYATTADEDDNILLIPLDYGITSEYSASDREVLYARSLHYVFNSRVITKIKWYQRGAFRILMLIISIIITIINPPAGLAAFAASTGVSIVVLAIIMNILIAILVQLVMRIFVQMFGTKFAMLVAIAAILYGGYQAFAGGSGSFGTALEYVNMGNGLVAEVTKQKFEELQQEYEEFNNMVETEQEKIDKAKEELDYNKYLAPLVVFGETPTEYFQRTVHSGNIGVLAIDAVSNYVDIALSLPKLTQTIGENE